MAHIFISSSQQTIYHECLRPAPGINTDLYTWDLLPHRACFYVTIYRCTKRVNNRIDGWAYYLPRRSCPSRNRSARTPARWCTSCTLWTRWILIRWSSLESCASWPRRRSTSWWGACCREGRRGTTSLWFCTWGSLPTCPGSRTWYPAALLSARRPLPRPIS